MALLLKASALFLLISICQAKKPTLTPSGSEIIKKEGESLTLKCTSDEPMVFYTDLEDPKKRSRSTEETFGVIGGQHSYYFKKTSLVLGDQGWYGCADKDIKVDKTDKEHPYVSWIRVYVISKKPKLQPSKSVLVKNEGDPLELSCSSNDIKNLKFHIAYDDPTAASSKVELELSSVVEGSSTYTIRKKSLLSGDKGWYGCADRTIEVDTHKRNQSDVSWIYVNVHAKVPKLYPRRREIKIKENQELNLKCTGHREIHFFMLLKNSGEGSKRIERTHMVKGGLIEHSLQKKSVDKSDSGWYACAFDNVNFYSNSNPHSQENISWIHVEVESWV